MLEVRKLTLESAEVKLLEAVPLFEYFSEADGGEVVAVR